jgi:hypothetical protein
MIRTSIILPTPLYHRLTLAAQQERKSLSALIRDLLAKALAGQEKVQLKRTYAALEKLNGVGPKGITDASTTINETLYGEHGAMERKQFVA